MSPIGWVIFGVIIAGLLALDVFLRKTGRAKDVSGTIVSRLKARLIVLAIVCVVLIVAVLLRR